METEKFIRPALLQRPIGDAQARRVRCLTCERRCVLDPGDWGWCQTRKNHDGVLVTVTYGRVSGLFTNPIEKKPLYHFYPGSVALTAGSYSCNFSCPWCQNYHISKVPPAGGEFFSPARFVAQAINRQCQGTSISLNEPTLSLEWSLEVFRLARQAGLYNTFVTNGYMTTEALERLAEAGLDAMNVDLKGSEEAVREYCQAEIEPVWRNLSRAQELGIWVEVTTLVVPGVSDDVETLAGIAGRLQRTLGPHTPWHVNRYYPAYRHRARPTPLHVLEQARSLARDIGLRYVYIGNISGHFAENTYCPSCGRMLVQRWGTGLVASHVRNGRCPECDTEISGQGWNWQVEG
ncbi:MAG: AmmeMemoRadiSam system radical SAM enzyme [Anaerolineae bacterium]|jgi:pyruvate formate lyase activating enzyme